jgi:hypothetical protein
MMICAFLVCLAASATVSARSGEQTGDEKSADRSGSFSQFGIGAGMYSEWNGDSANALAVGLEGKFGSYFSDHMYVFLLANFALHGTESGSSYARWVFKEDDFLLFKVLFLGWFIPIAFLADSHAMVGPGIGYTFSDQPPSLYLEGGGGFTGTKSITEEKFYVGFGLFGGAGIEITERLGFGARITYAPPALRSWWTPSTVQAVTATAMVYFR